MAYFANGSEGMCFDEQCARCKYNESVNESTEANPESVAEFAPGECPDNPGTTYTAEYCGNCTKREGCPVWGDK